MATSTLIVGSTSYNVSARKTARLLVDGWCWDVDADYWCEFHEYAAFQTPLFNGPQQVTLVGPTGAYLFTGDMISVQPTWGELGRTWGYRCLGLKYRANWIPVTATDGSGTIRLNVDPSTNLDYYIPSLAGLSVGGMLSYLFTQHATALTAAGITTDSTTAASLAALTLVPSYEVDVSGDRLWREMEGILDQWMRNIRLLIVPTGAGTGVVRVVDVTAGTSLTLTCGTDPIDPPMLARNWTNCATAVTCRGLGVIEPGYVQTLNSTLTPAWSSANQNAWNYAAYTDPAGAIDSGTVTSVGSTTSVTIQSSNTALTWATNYWSGIQAWISLTNTSGSGLTFTEMRQITANTSLSAGGTSTLTLDYALTNTTYTNYNIIGTAIPLSSGGLSEVWRLYNITDPGSWIATHLVREFPVEVPFVGVNATSGVLTKYPTCQILYSGVGGPLPFVVDPVHGQVLFTNPVVTLGNSASVLAIGGSGVVAPTNIYMMLAYSRGALTTRYPSSGYSGTAYSVGGLERNQTVDVPDWAYAGNTSVIAPYAQMLQTAVRDTVVEGTITYKGWYTTTMVPTGGWLVNLAGNGYTTGDEALNAPLRSYTVRYTTGGTGGTIYTTELGLSTRKDPRTGQGYYSHLTQLGQGSQLSTVTAGFEGFNGTWQGAGQAVSDMFADQPEVDEASDYGVQMDSGPSNAGTPYMSPRARKAKKKRDAAAQKRLAAWMPSTGNVASRAVNVPAMPGFSEEEAPSGEGSTFDDGSPAAPAAPVVPIVQPKPSAPKPYVPSIPGAPTEPAAPIPTIDSSRGIGGGGIDWSDS